MKVIYRLVTLFIICDISTLSAQTFLYSIPRSGSHFFIYSMGYLTLKPFTNIDLLKEGRNADMNSPFANPFKLDIDPQLPPLLVRTHSKESIDKIRSNQDKLILILRNPLEVIIAEKKMKSDPDREITEHDLNKYIEYITYFDKWPKDRRLLLYYEDLIDNPREVFDKALTFLNHKKNRLDPFIDRIDYFRNLARQKYSAHFPHNPVQSSGLAHHRYDLANWKKTHNQIISLFSRKYPRLYQDYLKRY